MSDPGAGTPVAVVAADPERALPLLAAIGDGWTAADVTLLVAGERGRALLDPARVGRIVVADGLDLDGPPAAAAEALAAALGPARVTVVDGSPSGRDLAGWIAARTDAELAWAVERIDGGRDGLLLRRVVDGGSARLLDRRPGDRPLVALVRGGRAEPATASALAEIPLVRAAVPDGSAAAAGAPLREREPDPPFVADDDRPRPLAGARIVVAVGRGIGGPDAVALFRRLAVRLGAGLGATRAVVDAGWLPFAHQVGQTGAVVTPDVYLAFGVSGAVQHLVGMRDSRTIVAINRDRGADLCRVADVVVEGDAVAVAETLLDHLEHERNRGA